MIKELKDGDPTPEFVDAFLLAHLPKDCGKIVPMLQQIFRPITAYVRVEQKMAKQGAGGRLLMGVFFTYFDLVLDIQVAKTYLDEGQHGFFAAAVLFIVLPLVVQAFAAKVLGQNWRDAASCMLGIKPLLDSWRVWKGTPAGEGQHFSHNLVMAITKLVEVGFECFPQGLLLTTAVLSQPLSELSDLRALSLASSFFTSGFILASGMLDSDQDEQQRRVNQYWYGFISSDAVRKYAALLSALLFFAAYLASATLVIAATGVALGPAAAGGYLVTGLVAFLAVQYVRGNWFFFIWP